MRITNYELRITRAPRFFSALVFLCALCAFAGNAFAQSNLEFFAETIRRGNVEQKRDALFHIRNLENAAASGVAVPALTDKSEIVRAAAAFSVIFLPADEAVAVLSPLLNDKKEFVRREAAYALGKTRNTNAVNSLLRVLQKDKVLEVRAASVVALGLIGDAAAVSELIKILQRKPSEKEEFLRRSAARSIGQIAQIIQTNKVKVQTPEDFLPDKNISIDEPKYPNLIEAFPTFRTANETLIQILQNRREADDVKRETAFALGAIGDTSAIPVLQSNLDAEDYYLAEISREALRKITLLSQINNRK
ncbi:MAG: HEAT repeat domain-containing protein [Acidobacteriota bacterium]|nr:HEAT repeat domain-containing protein [Acidobacteriota bacterium]